MSRLEECRRALDLETKRLAAMSYEQLMSALRELQHYEIEIDSKRYQIEVELVENTGNYVHVVVSADDGSFPASLAPVTDSFICRKAGELAR